MFSKLKYDTQKKIMIVMFLFVPLMFLLTFTYYPTAKMFYWSFCTWDGFSPKVTWVGFANYIQIFKDPLYFSVFKTSLYYFVGGLLQIVLAFYLAIILNSKIAGKSIFKAIYFFPYILSGVAISLVFLTFFKPDGTLDSVLRLLGVSGKLPLWFGNPKLINISLAATSVWRYIGFNFILFLGSIQSVSPDILEAAELDGASEWQKVRHIILPKVKNIIKLTLILNVSGAISAFEIPYIMTGGSNGSMTFIMKTVNTAFKFQHYGLAAAMAVIVLVIVACVSSLQYVIIKEEE